MNKNFTILYAEDDFDDFMILSDAFRAFNEDIELVRAENGLKVIDYLKQIESAGAYPSLIILDLNMPVMDGKETLTRLKSIEQFSDIPVVIFTTSSDVRDKRILEKYDVPFYTKPISYQDLKPIVEMFVAHSGLASGSN
ncbi:MAG: response regulator [Williamsia sp.]|nr:response regulator [Williamsia sp.]